MQQFTPFPKCERDAQGLCIHHGAIFPVHSDGPSAYCLVDHRDTARDLAAGTRRSIASMREEIKKAELLALQLDREAQEWNAKLEENVPSDDAPVKNYSAESHEFPGHRLTVSPTDGGHVAALHSPEGKVVAQWYFRAGEYNYTVRPSTLDFDHLAQAARFSLGSDLFRTTQAAAGIAHEMAGGRALRNGGLMSTHHEGELGGWTHFYDTSARGKAPLYLGRFHHDVKPARASDWETVEDERPREVYDMMGEERPFS